MEKKSLEVILLLITCGYSLSKEVMCLGRSFICYDEKRFYQCTPDNDHQYITGYLQTCPLGMTCNDLNEFECEEDISKEFLTERKYHYKFSEKEGRKHIIDD